VFALYHFVISLASFISFGTLKHRTAWNGWCACGAKAFSTVSILHAHSAERAAKLLLRRYMQAARKRLALLAGEEAAEASGSRGGQSLAGW